ncbi:unnamed protein product [Ostreobium quekettii]|uniref:J domain-containing protein n=1 Tax=Ostreobium quekettii TaxID=121088 RepID=A0A8S1IS06_9CHLO|nr:unnamed protein product [Ostreobium quekettii]|eukprot:evm.model.scf_1323.4 EVM.evm.TU.scf_1323.4   scf_1323:20450-23873(-)
MVSAPHNVLGVPASASKDEVKAAYRKLCLKYHPDMCPPSQKQKAAELFGQISEAYSAMMTGSHQPQFDTRSGGRAWTPPRARVRVSNRVVALIISLPVVLTGIKVGMFYGRLPREGDDGPNLWTRTFKGWKGPTTT